MSTVLNYNDAERILKHWLNTPPNGYIGVRYARNLKQLMLKPMTDDNADMILQWLQEDIPLFKNLNSEQLSIVSKNVGFDKKEYFIRLGNSIVVPIPNSGA